MQKYNFSLFHLINALIKQKLFFSQNAISGGYRTTSTTTTKNYSQCISKAWATNAHAS
jgi:hypothetical protein